MSARELRPVPTSDEAPYGTLRITIWSEPDRYGTRSGRTFTGPYARGQWRGQDGRSTTLPGEHDWTLDGFSFDYFNRGFLFQAEDERDAPIREALRLLNQWAVDQGYDQPHAYVERNRGSQ